MKFLLTALFVSFLFFGTECRRKYARDNVIEDINFRFYTGRTLDDFVDIGLLNSIQLLEQDGFERSNMTVFYALGYTENTNTESVQTILQAYLDYAQDYNVVLIDWSNMSGGSYRLNAVPNCKVVGEAVARQLSGLVEGGLSVANIHLIGHSLGSHVVGFVGSFIRDYNISLIRITGLDPAMPGFYPGYSTGHLSASDADYVDIIHTDAGNLGYPNATGTADFWPNGGSNEQPGCSNSLCSHRRSWRFWSEMLQDPSSYPSVPYNSYEQFKLESAKHKKPINYFGTNADPRKSGNYYFQTNSLPPYGRGLQGTIYIDNENEIPAYD